MNSCASKQPASLLNRFMGLFKHNLTPRPVVTTALVLVVLSITLSVIFYVQKTLSDIESALPARLSKQERETRVLVNNMESLTQALGFARANSSPERISAIRQQIHEMDQYLREYSDNYQFDDVLGVAAIYTKLNPAILDIKTWMSHGIYNFGPTSKETLKLSADRAKQSHAEAKNLLLEAGKLSAVVLRSQAQRIAEFRNVMILTLSLLTAMTLSLILLGLRLQRNILALKVSEEKNQFRANYDTLTQLPNRANFVEHLSAAISRSRRIPGQTALLFIDLDRFKTVNDTLGHDVGDKLLKQAAKRICKSVRETDIVSRLGGDEFTVLLPNMADGIYASIVAKCVLAQLAEPFHVNGHEIYSGASIGITMCPQDGDIAHTLLKNADMAMYEAKGQGRNTFRYFTSQLTARASQFLELDKEMRRALAQDELQIHYQPIYNMQTGSMMGVEALLRWEHPSKGLVLPADFINVAEETGLIEGIGRWVLRRACIESRKWLDQNVHDNFYLAVNISVRQFKSGLDKVQLNEILQETGFPANQLLLEITETLLMDDDTRIKSVLADFRAMGVRLALDDFGTGYSALSYLREFPVTSLKIDRSFIQDIATNANDRRLVEAILTMANGLGLTTVAEGVENGEQDALLRNLQCDMVQGYFHDKPQSAAAIETLVRHKQLDQKPIAALTQAINATRQS